MLHNERVNLRQVLTASSLWSCLQHFLTRVTDHDRCSLEPNTTGCRLSEGRQVKGSSHRLQWLLTTGGKARSGRDEFLNGSLESMAREQ